LIVVDSIRCRPLSCPHTHTFLAVRRFYIVVITVVVACVGGTTANVEAAAVDVDVAAAGGEVVLALTRCGVALGCVAAAAGAAQCAVAGIARIGCVVFATIGT